MKGQLKTYHDAVPTKVQHTRPCSDCPWARTALPGWLGNMTAEDWVQAGHSDGIIECHTTDKQCAGAAIYRANVCKAPRDPNALRLTPDVTRVFKSPQEFREHHERGR